MGINNIESIINGTCYFYEFLIRLSLSLSLSDDACSISERASFSANDVKWCFRSIAAQRELIAAATTRTENIFKSFIILLYLIFKLVWTLSLKLEIS